mmetsp:Transcript_91507/g.200543  ORF Transcript_91507/g.200543 Transcript_91507/m.200543 type:complete len:189 (+) Transcript_91507:1031-1597(+)
MNFLRLRSVNLLQTRRRLRVPPSSLRPQRLRAAAALPAKAESTTVAATTTTPTTVTATALPLEPATQAKVGTPLRRQIRSRLEDLHPQEEAVGREEAPAEEDTEGALHQEKGTAEGHGEDPQADTTIDRGRAAEVEAEVEAEAEAEVGGANENENEIGGAIATDGDLRARTAPLESPLPPKRRSLLRL